MADSVSSELILDLPKDVVQNCNGFSMDFGGSVLKVVYRHKDDTKEMEDREKDSKTAKLRLLSYARPDYKDALEMLKQNCHISRDVEESPVIFTTGIGCYQYAETINNTLNVKTKILTEFDCFVKSFYYLAKHQTMAELEFMPSAESSAKMEVLRVAIMKTVEMFKSQIKQGDMTGMKLPGLDMATPEATASSVVSDDKPLADALPDLYPCILAVIGSAAVLMMVNADGSFQVLDGTNRAGRMFLGLGSLLTDGPRTYEDLMDLAVRGNNKHVDIFGSDLKSAEKPKENLGDDADIYSLFENEDMLDNCMFCYGKGVENKLESFRKEDLVRAVLHTMILDLVQCMTLAMVVKGIKRCFISGSFINHELVRDLMNEEWLKRSFTNVGLTGKNVKYEVHFLKVGSHLGALGALINNTEAIVPTTNDK